MLLFIRAYKNTFNNEHQQKHILQPTWFHNNNNKNIIASYIQNSNNLLHDNHHTIMPYTFCTYLACK